MIKVSFLLRRDSINSNLLINQSIANGPKVNIKQISNGINITFYGEANI